MAQTGYPWTLDLHVLYDLSADGLTVTHTATNLSPAPAPFASGAHPYLRVGDGPVDGWELTLPAATRLTTDEQRIPVGEQSVEDTVHDFRVSRPIRDAVLDDAFGDVDRDSDGVTTATVRDPASGLGVALWMDDRHHWLQVFSADDGSDRARCALAVEPMTAPPDAFRSGRDLVTLGPGRRRQRRVLCLLGDPLAVLSRISAGAVSWGRFQARKTTLTHRQPRPAHASGELGSLPGTENDPHAPPPAVGPRQR